MVGLPQPVLVSLFFGAQSAQRAPRHPIHACQHVPREEQVRWMRATAAGDARALERLYTLFGPGLRRLACGLLDDPEETRDVVHDVFARLGARAAAYDDKRGSVWVWLTTVVRNAAIDRNRTSASRRRIARLIKASDWHGHLTGNDDVLAFHAMREALAVLPSVQRSTLELAFWADMPYAEIAALHGVSVNTVKTRAARGMKVVRKRVSRLAVKGIGGTRSACSA
jgi:RNA polymerase sigma-70 factor, ECF subfamily